MRVSSCTVQEKILEPHLLAHSSGVGMFAVRKTRFCVFISSKAAAQLAFLCWVKQSENCKSAKASLVERFDHMLKAQSILCRAGSHSWQQDEHLFHLTEGESGEVGLTKTEVASGLLHSRSALVDSISELPHLRVVCSKEYLVQYDPATGEHRVFNLSTCEVIDTLSKPMQSPSQKITLACEPQLENGFFLFACEDDTFYALLIRKQRSSQQQQGSPVKKAAMSKSFKLHKSEENKLEKARGKLVKIVGHPSLPVVFLVFSQGPVQIWSYERLYRQLLADLSATSISSPTESQGLDAEVEEGTEDQSELGEEVNVPSKKASTRSKSKQKLYYLSSVGTLAAPLDGHLASFHSSLANLPQTVSAISIQPSGRLVSLIYSQSVVAVYDLQSIVGLSCLHGQAATVMFTSLYPLVPPQLDAINANLTPRGSPKEGILHPHNLSHLKEHSRFYTEPDLEHRFQLTAFHPSVPILLLLVSRRRMITKVASSFQIGKAKESSGVVFEPLPSVICVLSLFPSHMPRLQCIGSQALQEGLPRGLGKEITNRFSTLNLNPLAISLTTSQHVVLQYMLLMGSRPDNLKESKIYCVYSFAESFLYSRGLSSILFGLQQSVQLPLGAYLYGLPATHHAYRLLPQTRGPNPQKLPFYDGQEDILWNALSFQDPSAATSSQSKQARALPRAFISKGSFVHNQQSGENAKGGSELFHDIYEVHYLANSTGSRSNGQTSASQHQDNSYQVQYDLIQQVPAEIDAKICTEAIKQTYSWLKLEKEDYVLLSGIKAQDETIHHFLPQSLSSLSNDGSGQETFLSFCGVIYRSEKNENLATVYNPSLMHVHGGGFYRRAVLLLLQQPVVQDVQQAEQQKAAVSLVYLNFRDLLASSSSVDSQMPLLWLALAEDGKTVKVLRRSQPQEAIKCTTSFLLDVTGQAERMWLCSASDNNHYLAVTEGVDDTDSQILRLYRFSRQTLLSNSAERVAWQTQCKLVLHKGEVVMDAVWQDATCHANASVYEQYLTNVCCYDRRPFLAVRTNQRVLILTSELSIVNSIGYGTQMERLARMVTSQPPTATPTNRYQARLQAILAQHSNSFAKPSVSPLDKGGEGENEYLETEVRQVLWMGAALMVLCSNGHLRYLLPLSQHLLHLQVKGKKAAVFQDSLAISRALGIFDGHGVHRLSRSQLLCTLPYNLTPTHFLRVLLLLPDRLYLSFSPHSGLGQCKVTVRPLNPLEPLIMGLLANRFFAHCQQRHLLGGIGGVADVYDISNKTVYLDSQEQSSSSAFLSLLVYVSSLFCPAPVQGRPVATKAMQAQHSRSFICLLFSLDLLQTQGKENQRPVSPGHVVAAVMLRSLEKRESRSFSSHAAGDFPLHRHIPAALFFYHLVQLFPCSSYALLPLLAEKKTVLGELLLQQESFGGSALPLRRSALSLQALNGLIVILRQLPPSSSFPRMDEIYRLLDILDSLPLLLWAMLAHHPDEVHRFMMELLSPDYHSLLDLPVLTVMREIASQHLRDQELANEVEPLYRAACRQTRLPHLTHSLRSQALHHSLPAPSSKKSKEVQEEEEGRVVVDADGVEKKVHLAALNRARQDIAARYRLVFPGPTLYADPFALHPLNQEVVEDCLGQNARVEIVPTSDILSSVETGTTNGQSSNSSNAFFANQPRPEHWVDLVGQGREMEKVILYCRFSDVYLPGDLEHFSNAVARPCTQMTFLNLAKNERPSLELFSSSPYYAGFGVAYSLSKVDPGDRHEVVKTLNDLTYSPSPGITSSSSSVQGAVECGLRCHIFRGEPLDVGLYHVDPLRNKLTVEVFVDLGGPDELQAALSAHPQNEIVLWQRVVYSESQSPQANIYKFYIANSGHLAMQFGAVQATMTSLHVPDYLRRQKAADDADTTENHFLHLCWLLDSSRCTFQLVNGVVQVVGGEEAEVSLLVDGQMWLDLQPIPTLPPIEEQHLAQTLLYFMPNVTLMSYRLTELRLFAGLRTASEVEATQIAYLPLASRRIRLQLQLKNTKKLFNPYKEVALPAVCRDQGEVYIVPVEAEIVPAAPSASSAVSGETAALPLPPSKGVVGAPPAKPVRPGLLASKPSASVPADVTSAPAALPPQDGALNARQRRLLALKQGRTQEAAPSAHPSPAASTASAVASVDGRTASDQSTNENGSHFEAKFDTFFSQPSTGSIPPPSITSPVVEAPVSRSTTGIEASPLSSVQGTTELSVSGSRIFGLNTEDSSLVLRLIHSNSGGSFNGFQSPGLLSLADAAGGCMICASSQRASTVKLSSFLGLSSATLQFPMALSALLTSPTKRCHLAVHDQTAISIYNIYGLLRPHEVEAKEDDDIKKVVSLPTPSLPILFMQFISPELLLFITPHDGYTWKASPGAESGGAPAKPIKILQRADLVDLKK
eukprot:scaffold3045_cov179-Ochromonas_danica.AAC.2